MADKVSVRRHVRKRTGRTAQIAASLGLPETVNVRDFSRRRPSPRKEPQYMGGRWEEKFWSDDEPRVWIREYATGVEAIVFPYGGRGYSWQVEDGKGRAMVAFGESKTLQEAKKSSNDAFQKWFLKRELKARADYDMLYPREPMGRMFDFDTDDMLLTDLNVPPEMKAELKAYMGGLKRSPAPKVA